jgi:hypothetical protein
MLFSRIASYARIADALSEIQGLFGDLLRRAARLIP